jgi:hypothetical protein
MIVYAAGVIGEIDKHFGAIGETEAKPGVGSVLRALPGMRGPVDAVDDVLAWVWTTIREGCDLWCAA